MYSIDVSLLWSLLILSLKTKEKIMGVWEDNSRDALLVI